MYFEVLKALLESGCRSMLQVNFYFTFFILTWAGRDARVSNLLAEHFFVQFFSKTYPNNNKM